RYFPDPDLLPLEFEQSWVDALAAVLPELPDEKKARFVSAFALTPYDAAVLVAEQERAAYFEAHLGRGTDPKTVANWVINEILGRLNKEGRGIEDCPVKPEANVAILAMIADGTISGKIAKEVLDIVWIEGGDPRDLVEARGMRQVTDTGAIEKVID